MSSDSSAAPAGLWRRLAAMAYDWLLLGSAYFVLTLVLLAARGGAAVAPGTWWYTLSLVMVGFLFYGWFWTHGGQTLGLRAWNLRVQRADGGPLSWSDASRRFAAAATLLLPPGLGLAWIAVDRQRAAWHDRLSRTRIVRIGSR
jgi:uncharacterized RDD family membrane protein YckC